MFWKSNYVRRHVSQGEPKKLAKLVREIFAALEDEYSEDNFIGRFAYFQELVRDEATSVIVDSYVRYGSGVSAYFARLRNVVRDVYDTTKLPCDKTKIVRDNMEKTYVGTKIVSARPMTAHEFAASKGMPVDSENAHGYLVTYDDGYASWSPKAVFERCYRELTDAEKALVG